LRSGGGGGAAIERARGARGAPPDDSRGTRARTYRAPQRRAPFRRDRRSRLRESHQQQEDEEYMRHYIRPRASH